MKCLYPNKILSVTADVADPAYPASNVVRDVNDPAEPYRSTGQAGTLTLHVLGGASGLGLAGMVGNTLTIKVYTVAPDKLSFGDDLFGSDDSLFGVDEDFFVTRPVFEKTCSLSGIDSWHKWFTQTGTPVTGMVLEYPYQSSEHTVVVTIDTGLAEKKAELAVASAAPVKVWREPVSLKLSLVDYSIKDRFNSGGLYYVKDSVVRYWTGGLRQTSDEFQVWINGIAREIGATPVFWEISDQSNPFWSTFAGFDPLPTVDGFNKPFAVATFGLLEEI